MKLLEAVDDQKTVRLGIVKLGTAVGKVCTLCITLNADITM